MCAKMRFLLFDMDPQISMYIRDLVNYFGYDVDWSMSLPGAKARLIAQAYDGLLLDMQSAGGHGPRLLDWLRETDCQVPVVMMSPGAHGGLRKEPSAGLRMHWLKTPIKPSELKQVLGAVAHQEERKLAWTA